MLYPVCWDFNNKCKIYFESFPALVTVFANQTHAAKNTEHNQSIV